MLAEIESEQTLANLQHYKILLRMGDLTHTATDTTVSLTEAEKAQKNGCFGALLYSIAATDFYRASSFCEVLRNSAARCGLLQNLSRGVCSIIARYLLD